jgi:hypothetical protein
VYLEKRAREFFGHAQKQGSTSRSSTDENGFGLPARVKLHFQNTEAVKVKKNSLNGAIKVLRRQETDKKHNHRAKAHKPIRGVKS